MMKFLYSTILIALCLGIFSCSKSDTQIIEDIAAADEQTILDYLEENNLTAEKTPSGLYYIINVAGNGDNPTLNSNVEVIYRGYFPDGETFDKTPDATTSNFPLTNVIQGWQEGIPLFKKGGSGVLLIPSALGYGTSGQGDIPADQVLIFDIELIDFF